MADLCLLIGDIGGTNARFALANASHAGEVGYEQELILQCADYATSESAIDHYLKQVGRNHVDAICLAAAGPVVNQRVKFTNNHWQLDAEQLKQTNGTDKVCLLNDFEAMACSLPHIPQAFMTAIGNLPSPDLTISNFVVGVIGAGTGLGAAGLVRAGHLPVPLVTEAGHVAFGPENEKQAQVREQLAKRFGRVSDERLVSGMGLENLYVALCEMNNLPLATPSAAEIFRAFDLGEDPIAVDAVNMFFEVFGQVAGNFALSLGAFDGIFLVGGVIQRYPGLLANSNFRQAFESKGRHRHLMERIPTILVRQEQPGLLGASAVARQMGSA